MQMRFEDIPEKTLAGPGWLEAVLARMDLEVGERDRDDLRRSGRKAPLEGVRGPKETLTQYSPYS
eukprot:3724803-Pyramimonas_sp.AAC.1